MAIQDVVVRSICELSCSTVVGVAGAAVVGLTPAIGAGVAAIAYVATLVAEETLQRALFSDDLFNNGDNWGDAHKFIGNILVAAAWCAGVTLVAQQALLYAGLAVPFGFAFGIAGVSVIAGYVLGNGLYNNRFGET